MRSERYIVHVQQGIVRAWRLLAQDVKKGSRYLSALQCAYQRGLIDDCALAQLIR